MTLKQELAFYNDEGFNVIALKKRDKLPDFQRIPSWLVYQTRQSRPEERELWWPGNPLDDNHLNVGVVTGAISNNLIVVDIDNEDAYRALWDSNAPIAEFATVETGKGFHLYLRTPDDPGPIFTMTHPVSGDAPHHIKANGGYVVAPPSIHPNGSVYKWTNRDVRTFSIEEIVGQLEQAGFVRKAEQAVDGERGVGKWPEMFAAVVSSGGRADHMSRICGFLRAFITSEAIARELMRGWNEQHCQPPLEVREVDAIVKSMFTRYKPVNREEEGATFVAPLLSLRASS